jgi:archaellum component FlaF (FlaF/FlaG flagellin family)
LLKRFLSKRAVSTVISTVMMISIAVTMGAIMVGWAMATVGNYQSGAGTYFSNVGESMKESIAIENVWYNASPTNRLNVYVRNVGAIDVDVVEIYVRVDASSYKMSNASFPRKIPIPASTAGEKGMRWFYSTIPNLAGKTLFITVATKRGNQVRATWVA